MSDAKYRIYNAFNGKDYITLESQLVSCTTANDIIPTYTVSELLYKLHEYIHPTIDGKEYAGGLEFIKDAPFYIFYYALETPDYNKEKGTGDYNETYIRAECEYPIESLSSLLIQCYKKGIGLPTGSVEDISNK